MQADDNLLPLIETVVESGSQGRTLQVRFKRGERVVNHGQIRVTVDVVQLKAVSTAGSGDVFVDGLKTPSFQLSIAGSSDAKLNGLATGTLDLRISGSGDVLAAGTATSVKLSIAGSGDANLAGLVADDVHVRIAGSGDASVTANKVARRLGGRQRRRALRRQRHHDQDLDRRQRHGAHALTRSRGRRRAGIAAALPGTSAPCRDATIAAWLRWLAGATPSFDVACRRCPASRWALPPGA